ncbi:hypothetical protein BU14_0625s0001 [Porphyra umbilicalis]|uniref:Uncharacterized protein n=1 Tax=Porphyra umbilicalis TaxID=2786 RepID=A0A1X6NQQ6_PORUM|nr:hypothetical protein BU14_0625s0001 [Porphyra umbilicalis]|eukprot:OSX70951.1 hypothetical protein BU14_0625s0001 [Porphyra umbilicalis]
MVTAAAAAAAAHVQRQASPATRREAGVRAKPALTPPRTPVQKRKATEEREQPAGARAVDVVAVVVLLLRARGDKACGGSHHTTQALQPPRMSTEPCRLRPSRPTMSVAPPHQSRRRPTCGVVASACCRARHTRPPPSDRPPAHPCTRPRHHVPPPLQKHAAGRGPPAPAGVGAERPAVRVRRVAPNRPATQTRESELARGC